MDISLDVTVAPAQLVLAGEMTIYAAAGLKAPLLDALRRCPALEVDLSAVSELDSAGLQLLILAKREAAATGRQLGLVGHGPAVLEMIELYDLAAFFGDPLLIGADAAGGEA